MPTGFPGEINLSLQIDIGLSYENLPQCRYSRATCKIFEGKILMSFFAIYATKYKHSLGENPVNIDEFSPRGGSVASLAEVLLGCLGLV